jgi:hypothetical protein
MMIGHYCGTSENSYVVYTAYIVIAGLAFDWFEDVSYTYLNFLAV